MLDILAIILAIAGGFFTLVAAIGLWRMPDVFSRLHCTTKAGTLGATLLVIALAVSSADPAIWARAAVLAIFLLVTGPIAGHAIARAAWRAGERPHGECDPVVDQCEFGDDAKISNRGMVENNLSA